MRNFEQDLLEEGDRGISGNYYQKFFNPPLFYYFKERDLLIYKVLCPDRDAEDHFMVEYFLPDGRATPFFQIAHKDAFLHDPRATKKQVKLIEKMKKERFEQSKPKLTTDREGILKKLKKRIFSRDDSTYLHPDGPGISVKGRYVHRDGPGFAFEEDPSYIDD